MSISFNVNEADLAFILKQIKVAEAETSGLTLQQIIGPNAAILPMGLRHVDGTNNNLLPGGSLLGAADTVLPRLADPSYTNGTGSISFPTGPGSSVTITGHSYATPGSIADTAPRTISNLIVDQSIANPAAIEAWFANPLAVAAFEEAHPGKVPVRPGEPLGPYGLHVTDADLSNIPNQSPDIGLSPGFNGWMTFFGQFFDHGLDLITKGGNGTVYIPLMPDDPLYDLDGFDNIAGNADDGMNNFMTLTRATPAPGQPTETVNTTTSWIDQNQTYTSHASHQVFLREYVKDASGHAVSTGKLLDGAHGGIATWAETKAQALTMLGIKLTDADIANVPLLRTDAYGKFIPGPNGYAQLVMAPDASHATTWFKEGTAAGITTAGSLGTGHAFLDDIAHNAVPVIVGGVLQADDDHVAGNAVPMNAQGRNTEYDDELLDAHFITGDGRGNENIGLTAVHTIFHAEHNRLVEANKATLVAAARTGNADSLALLNEYLLVDVPGVPADIGTLVWNGERLFQAAKFVTEMQYQHLVFEEFARKVQPNVDPFVFTNTPDIDPSIVAEFAHTVYRFGHSMLTDTVSRMDADMNQDDILLFDAFLNPLEFIASGVTASEAAGAIIRGMTRQVGNEIDEFVVGALRNQLLGLPLDLAALNIARARDTGIPSLNDIRAVFYEQTGQSQLKPYVSWLDFAENLKNPLSIINFIAAYGTHSSITSATTIAAKRDAATLLVIGDFDLDGDGTVEAHERGPADRLAFLNSTGDWTNVSGRTITGMNAVDFWIGGLAEVKMEFGGMLGSTFNYVFETQMEKLQNGDRFYYLSRLQGTNMLNQLEPNTFTELVMRNTDLGDAGSSHLPGTLFDTPDLILEINQARQIDEDPVQDSAILQAINPKVVRHAPGADVDGDGHGDGGYLKFTGGEHVVLGGTEGNDTLIGDRGIDALWGDGGDDYLNARSESDQVFGGDGDDVIEDPFGDDFLRGENGNDVISGGAGFDILFGGAGSDFVVVGAETGEVFAGEGNDFILGGSSSDNLMGNEGDDWIQGGDGFDGVTGENSDLFFNSPIIGHDVLNGEGNDTDYDGESGDDIMVQGPGIQRSNGMLGFDWAIHKGDPNGANSDLGVPVFATQQDLTLRDRFDSVEGLSGWKFNDILTGTNFPTGAVGNPGGLINGPESDSKLTQEGVDRIHGLQAIVGDIHDAVEPDIILNPQNGADIILGGDGSDTIRGNAGDDILDGDAWLNVRIAVHANKDGTGPVLFSIDSLREAVSPANLLKLGIVSATPITVTELMLTRGLNPGQFEIVREILLADGSNDIDVAVYIGNRNEYAIFDFGDFVQVAHLTPQAGVLSDGIDTLRRIERLQFADETVVLNRATAGRPGISDATPTEGDAITASLAGISDDDGLPPPGSFFYQWQMLSGAVWTDIAGADAAGFTPTQAEVNHELRVRVSFIDGAGTFETVTSTPTQVVGDLFNGNNSGNNPLLTAGADRAFGNGGNDTLSGGGGDDTLVGGGGNDTYDVGDLGDMVTEDAAGGTDTVRTSLSSYTLGANLENLVYTGGLNFAGTGNGLANRITGGSGADSLEGGANLAGGDTLVGGAGGDTYAIRNAADVIIEAAGGGFDTVLTGFATHTLGANVENLTYTGAGNFAGNGNNLANIITGGSGNDSLDGGVNLVGGDTFIGGAGDDLYSVRNAADVVTELAGGGTDTVRTSLSSYTLGANLENLTLIGAGSTFAGTGNGLNNSITGREGADTLDGGVNTIGGDTLIGGAGDDLYILRNAADVIVETSGTDTVWTSLASHSLATGVENLVFTGVGAFTGIGNGALNRLVGGAGADNLSGGGGADTLQGGGGADVLTGDGGNDLFLFGSGEIQGDLITDFRTTAVGGAAHDHITFSGFAAGTVLVKQGFAAGTTTYAVQLGGITQETFLLTGNVTLAAGVNADYHFA